MRKWAAKKIGKVNCENDEVYVLNTPLPGEDGFYRKQKSGINQRNKPERKESYNGNNRC